MSARRPRRCLAVLLATAVLCGATAPRAEDVPSVRLEEIERDLERESGRAADLDRQSQMLADEMSRLQRRLVAAAKAAQDREEEISELEETLGALEDAAAQRATELAARREQLTAILGALQRLALQPPQAMLLGPTVPLDMIRSAKLLGVALPQVEARARTLRAELDALREIEEQSNARRQELASAVMALRAEREELETLLEEKRRLQAASDREREAVENRMRHLARQSKDLRELLAQVAAAPPPPVPTTKPAVPGTGSIEPNATPDRPAAQPAAFMRLDRPPEIREFPPAGASLVLPARGRITGTFGEKTETGERRKGIVIATRPAAQIVAPFDGKVVFRGPFRGYGEILILEHVGGYHTLLAGLDRTDAIAGQWLLAGEPVGVMGDAGRDAPELYLELRRDGQPISPLPWLNVSDSKTE